MFRNNKLKEPPLDIIFSIFFGAALMFALWKCPFGFGSYDDAFYLTVPHRLSMGDVLFADEWHVSQMAGLILTPLVWLYRTVTGSTDGILLAARYTYVVFHALISLFFYLRTKEYEFFSIAASLSWFLFAPYDIMALSYNTMAMDLILVSSLLLATMNKQWHWVLSGVCLAGAVLCCPYFAAAWFLYALGVGIRAFLERMKPAENRSNDGILSPQRLLWLTAGVAAAATLFFLYVLLTCGVRGVLDNLPYILSDPEHQGIAPLAKLQNTWYNLVHCHPLFQYVLIGFLVLLLILLMDHARNNRRGIYLAASCVLTLVSYALFWSGAVNTYYNAIMLPMLFAGLTAFLLCQKRPWKLFVTLFLGGIVYAVAVTLGSNNFFYAISMACAVTNAVSLLFVGKLLQEIAAEQTSNPWRLQGALCAAALTAAVLVLLIVQVRVKALHCFMDDSPPALTFQLKNGPARGIRTTEYRSDVYERLNAELQIYKTLPHGKLLILNERSWCCLSADPMEYATFSGWISGEDQAALDRLEHYYQLNPDKVPDYIFLSRNSLFDDPDLILESARSQGYTLTESEFSYYLERK